MLRRMGTAYEKTTPSGKESPALSSVMSKDELERVIDNE